MFYGWIVLAVCFVNVCAEGAIKNLFPVVLLPLVDSFGWSRAATAGIFSIAGLVSGLGSPALGILLDKIGPRKFFPLGGMLLCAGLIVASHINQYWQLVAIYTCFLAVGENMISSYTNVAVIGRWFRRKRGTAIGIADTGTAVGAALFVPCAQWLTLHYDWRYTFLVFALIFFFMIVPTNLVFMRSRPEEKGQAPDGMPVAPDVGHNHAAGVSSERAVPLRRVLTSPSLHLLALARFFGSTATYLITVHLIAFFVDAGYASMLAASALAFSQLVSFAGRPLSGILSDRIGREKTVAISYTLSITSILVIVLAGDGKALWPIALFVLFQGMSLGPVGIAIGAKAADLFPGQVLGRVMGIINMGRGLGLALGPFLGGLLYDITRSYTLAFSMAIGFFVASFATFWFADRMDRPRAGAVGS